MSNNESEDSFEQFGVNEIDYNPFFVTNISFQTRDEAFDWAQRIAFDHGFSLVKATNCPKSRREADLTSTYIRCSRHGRPTSVVDPDKAKRRCSIKCQCKFRLRAVQNRQVDALGHPVVIWNILTADNFGFHNHEVAKYKDGDRHFAALNEDELEYIRQQVKANVAPKYIKNGLPKKTPDKSQPSSTQIYSQISKIRREDKGDRNPAQEMLSLAVKEKYMQWHERDGETTQLTHLFMSHPEEVKLFRTYPHVVLIDATYKTNVYKATPVECVGVTPCRSSFLIVVVILPSESESDYTWMLKKLSELLECTGLTPSAFVTDRELGLIDALEAVYSTIPHLLCRWHLNRAIEKKTLEKTGNAFITNDVMQGRESGWKAVIDAWTEEDLSFAWSCFCNKWKFMANYVGTTWGSYSENFVLCYTKHYFHLGNTATSRVESAHLMLKSWLKSANLNLDTMMSRIHSMLESQHAKIRCELEQSRSRPRTTTPMFSLLKGKVSTKAIDIMEEEIIRGTKLGIGLEHQCGCVLRTTHGLPCACFLIDLKNKGRRVHLDHIHAFWRTLYYDLEYAIPPNDNDLFEETIEEARASDPVKKRLLMEIWRAHTHPQDELIEPPVVRENPRGRPRGLTTRNMSGFEHARRMFGTPSTHGSATEPHRVGNFEEGASSAPLELSYTIGLFSTWNKRRGVPEVLWSYFDGWVDVGADDHCGFQVVSHAARGREDDHSIMRDWIIREIRSNDVYHMLYEDHLPTMNGLSRYENHLRRIHFSERTSCGEAHWMQGDDWFAVATMFNWTICVIATSVMGGTSSWQCVTVPPLRSSPTSSSPYGVLWVVNNGCHWMRLHSTGPAEEVPMPPLDTTWEGIRDPSVAHISDLYRVNMENWYAAMNSTPLVPRRRGSGTGHPPPDPNDVICLSDDV